MQECKRKNYNEIDYKVQISVFKASFESAEKWDSSGLHTWN